MRRSAAGKPLQYWRQFVDLAEHARGDAEFLAQLQELLHESVDGSDEQVRRLDDLVLGELDACSRPQRVDYATSLAMQVAGECHRPRRGVDVELQRLESITGSRTHPADLLSSRSQGQRGGIDGGVSQDARRQPDDVGLPAR